MGFVFMYPDMLFNHTKESMTREQGIVFVNLLCGSNILGTDDIDRVAKAVKKIPDDRLKSISRKEFISEFLNGVDYIDMSGDIV